MKSEKHSKLKIALGSIIICFALVGCSLFQEPSVGAPLQNEDFYYDDRGSACFSEHYMATIIPELIQNR